MAPKASKPAAEAEPEAFAPRRGRGRFELPTARGTAVYEGEWTETQVQRPVRDETDEEAKTEGKEAENPPLETVTVMVQDGKGKIEFPATKESFEGEWRQGRMWAGTFVYADGSTYEGEFQGTDAFHGRGTLVLASGDRYEGAWSEGQMHGDGRLAAVSCDQPAEWTGHFDKNCFQRGTGAALRLCTEPKALPPTVRFLLEPTNHDAAEE